MKSKHAYCLETGLKQQQIINKLEELEEVCSIKWNRKRDKFIVRKKIHRVSLARVPVRVYVKGNIIETKGTTQIKLSMALGMSLEDLLIFTILTFFILMYAGKKMGVDLFAVVITLAAITIYAFALTYVITRFTQIGKEICQETLDMLKRQLSLCEGSTEDGTVC